MVSLNAKNLKYVVLPVDVVDRKVPIASPSGKQPSILHENDHPLLLNNIEVGERGNIRFMTFRGANNDFAGCPSLI